MSLYIEDESSITLPIEVESIANLVVEAALDYIQCPFEAEVNLLLTDDEAIHEMNQEFRQVDRSTDVLSFPMLEYANPGDFSEIEEQEDAFNPETRRIDAWRYCDFKRTCSCTGRSLCTFSKAGVCFSYCT